MSFTYLARVGNQQVIGTHTGRVGSIDADLLAEMEVQPSEDLAVTLMPRYTPSVLVLIPAEPTLDVMREPPREFRIRREELPMRAYRAEGAWLLVWAAYSRELRQWYVYVQKDPRGY